MSVSAIAERKGKSKTHANRRFIMKIHERDWARMAESVSAKKQLAAAAALSIYYRLFRQSCGILVQG